MYFMNIFFNVTTGISVINLGENLWFVLEFNRNNFCYIKNS